jgi:acyl-CoA oxidase
MQELERDPLFKMDDIHDISKSELRERTMEKVGNNITEIVILH